MAAEPRLKVEYVSSDQNIHTFEVFDRAHKDLWDRRLPVATVWYANGTVRCTECAGAAAGMRADCPHANVVRYWLRKGRFPTMPPLPPVKKLVRDREPLWPEGLVRTSMERPYPLHDILRILADAAQHLFEVHDCDHQGWEVTREAMLAARAMHVRLTEARPEQRPRA